MRWRSTPPHFLRVGGWFEDPRQVVNSDRDRHESKILGRGTSVRGSNQERGAPLHEERFYPKTASGRGLPAMAIAVKRRLSVRQTTTPPDLQAIHLTRCRTANPVGQGMDSRRRAGPHRSRCGAASAGLQHPSQHHPKSTPHLTVRASAPGWQTSPRPPRDVHHQQPRRQGQRLFMEKLYTDSPAPGRRKVIATAISKRRWLRAIHPVNLGANGAGRLRQGLRRLDKIKAGTS